MARVNICVSALAETMYKHAHLHTLYQMSLLSALSAGPPKKEMMAWSSADVEQMHLYQICFSFAPTQISKPFSAEEKERFHNTILISFQDIK